MKNQSFQRRLRFAISGIKSAWETESSFRTHTFMSIGVLIFLGLLRPAPIWWAVIFLIIGGVLSLELLNTALEQVVDRLHPEQHPMIAKAKDCAAGAVLVLSIAAVAIFIALLVAHYGHAHKDLIPGVF